MELCAQARSCVEMGSPLYTHLLDRTAEDVEQGGPGWQVLIAHLAPGRGGAIALRLMAAVHRLVLTGETPALAEYYPSVGGTADLARAWPAFRAVLAERGRSLDPLIANPCQTNEVGRSAPILFGFLEVAARSERPLRILEVGASAGLNLRLDQFHYGGGGAAWGPADSPVDLVGLWKEPPPHIDIELRVVERRGCDPRPLDPTAPDSQLALKSSIWADQIARFARLRGALALAGHIPATVDEASLEEWLPLRLTEPRPGVATVVYHSVVDEYLEDEVRRSFHATLEAAGQRATADAPLAWVRLEPASKLRSHAATLTFWPGHQEYVLATSGAHGQDVRRVR
jgi:hypothetical protein